MTEKNFEMIAIVMRQQHGSDAEAFIGRQMQYFAAQTSTSAVWRNVLTALASLGSPRAVVAIAPPVSHDEPQPARRGRGVRANPGFATKPDVRHDANRVRAPHFEVSVPVAAGP
jgi:hypothetical protein